MSDILNQFDKLYFEDSPIAVCHLDTKGNFIAVNTAFSDLTGFPQEELVGKSFVVISHPLDIEGEASRLKRAVEGRIDNYSINKRFLSKMGKTIWVKVVAKPVKKDNLTDKVVLFITPLPNGGNFYVEKKNDGYIVRPTISFPKFVIDNLKWFIGILAGLFLGLVAIWDRLVKLWDFLGNLP